MYIWKFLHILLETCWAKGGAGAIEAAHYTLIGELVTVSTEELIDCSESCGSCKGQEGGIAFPGLVYTALHGVHIEDLYSYVGKCGVCYSDTICLIALT